jgi:hypothetical protein
VSQADSYTAANIALFDQFVSGGEQRWWHDKAEYLGALEVDHQMELDRALNRKIARLCALEDAVGIPGRAPIIVENVICVRQQAADFREETIWINGRETVAGR